MAWLGAAVAVWAAAAPVSAQRGDLGPAADALPGALRVGFATEAPARLSVQGTGGYGFIEGAGAEGGDHHRLEGGVAASVRPISWLAIALGADGRWDLHPNDDSGLGVPWLAARFGLDVLRELSLGLDARFDARGGDAPSIDVLGSRLSLRGLVTARPDPALRVGLAAGVRLDGTGRTVERGGGLQLGAGDAVSLAVTDSDAVLLGLAGAYDLGGVELLLELTWEPLFGDAAPPLGDSPLRVAAGGRAELTRGLAVSLIAELTTQPRRAVDPARLVEVEPRVRVLASLSYRFAFEDPAPLMAADEAAPSEPDPVDPPAARPPETSGVRGVVRDPEGAPVAAHVRALDADGEPLAETDTDAEGAFALELAPDTAGELEITAEGFAPETRALGESTAPLTIGLAPVVATGTLRGLVRSFSGRPVRATITVDGGAPTETDEDGVFEVDVEAGPHQVEIAADGYRTQRRELTVDENGVTILNADLRRQR